MARRDGAVWAAVAALCAASAACSGSPGTGPGGAPPQAARPLPSVLSPLRFVTVEGRPRLALLARDGDPSPAIVAVVATDAGPALNVALSAVVEARLLAAGLAVETRVDGGSFRVRLVGGGTGKFFAALAAAFGGPIAPGAPELAKAAERLAALKRHPLPAPEAVPAAECVGRLGLAPKARVLDVQTAEGLRELEGARARALTRARTAVGVVGSASACAEADRALAATEPWPDGPAAEDPWPGADSTGTHAANDVARDRGRITIALRASDPLAAVAAAERLAEEDGPLRARLAALPVAFRVTEVLGVARPRGGCVSVTAEATESARGAVAAAALAAAVTRKEMALEAAEPADPGTMARAVIAATDPRDAAARAAWWALAGQAQGAASRWATVLALAPDERGAELTADARRFEADLAAALRASDAPVVERRAAVEQGQGEVWVLLASPCGTTDEGPFDAGTSALAAHAAASRAGGAGGVEVEPWVTPDGVGVLAHVSTGGEDEVSAARRAAGAAGRAFAGEVPGQDTVSAARAQVLTQIERTGGPHGAALDELLGALTPDHPSQLHAQGLFSRLLMLSAPNVAARWQAVVNGPLRMAILANGGPAQAEAAFQAADRWLAPRPAAHGCPAVSDSVMRPGHYEVALPPGTELSQALIAAPVPGRGQAGREPAEVALHLLGGERGLVQAALDRTPLPAVATVRLLGGARTGALVIDVRAPQASLGDAVDEVKSLLERLGRDGPSDAEVGFASGKRERAAAESRFDPRWRLVGLWLGDQPGTQAVMNRGVMQGFFAGAFRQEAISVVEARKK